MTSFLMFILNNLFKLVLINDIKLTLKINLIFIQKKNSFYSPVKTGGSQGFYVQEVSK